jgi:FAD/FMN-containing dehydrogenase
MTDARSEDAWSDSVLVWNGVAASVPALVVRPASERELAAAVMFARDHGLRLRMTSRRGDVDGAFVAERCLTLDLTRLDRASPSRRGRTGSPR